MDINDINYELEGAIDQLNSAKDMLDQIPENLAGWLGIEEQFGDPEDVRAQLCAYSDIRSGLRFVADIDPDNEEDVEKLMNIVRTAKKEHLALIAINQFVSALTNAGILPRTEPVPTSVSTEEPAVADNVVSTAPFTTNQPQN